jgi:sulfoxide reductase catalytic subunit YedY
MDKPRRKDATSYNNFYEFGTDKATRRMPPPQDRPWTVEVEGLVSKPGRIALEDLLKLSPLEERIYRLRCVEGWSMVIPWVGYSLSALIKQVQPLGSAKYVEFVTLADKQMPGVRSGVLDWPYTEGLRMDEAMHPLTLLAFGMYGEVLPGRTARRCAWWCPGSTASRAPSPSSRSALSKSSPAPPGTRPPPTSTALFQREPRRRSPALEPGHRAAHRRGRPVRQAPQDAAVQRLRGQVGQLYAGMDLKKLLSAT